MVKKKNSVLPFVYLGIALFLVDFFSKLAVAKNLPLMGYEDLWYPYGGVPVFKNFLGIEFSIVHAINRGAAWGIFADYQKLLLFFRIVLVAITLIYAICINTNVQYNFPLTLIIAGAIGNIADYFIYGHVIDMFHFDFWGFDYPVFNVADVCICIGILWLVLFTSPYQKQSKGS